MLECWRAEANKRPSFEQVVRILEILLEGNLNEGYVHSSHIEGKCHSTHVLYTSSMIIMADPAQLEPLPCVSFLILIWP